MGGGDNGTPAPPDYAKLYQQGIDVYLRNLPRLLDTELDARRTYDGANIGDQQKLQQDFGPTMYAQQRAALEALDPHYADTREALRTAVTNDLASGTNLTPEQQKQFETQFRGAQAARGNNLSGAVGLAETYGKAQLGQQMYQQRLQNVGNFLSGPTPEQQLLAVQAVQPDRSLAYANPSAGAAGVNFGAQNYQNLLAAQQLQQQHNPWASAATGAASGAVTGTAISPGWGTVIGGLVGGAAGYFSDSTLKENVRELGRTGSGIPLIVFQYIGSKVKHVGAIAQDVLKVRPDAVTKDQSGYLKVNYDKLHDVPFFALEGDNLWLST
jgi:hypothetical protein